MKCPNCNCREEKISFGKSKVEQCNTCDTVFEGNIILKKGLSAFDAQVRRNLKDVIV